uniref:Uncharacterized protein n=1 Tax=Chromera velia CCMP2878 TaxID=1169474 RepID=A0A0G4HZ34_9ALVE|eukprot:Cvel_9605.t1-p1 / transcript=Cvel_9605.t1 / gene=Cvel_9605 / organism=Chromera_velia_CCMP2878 / gene_product=hypothetical protein / transcript_product=hypothetical protein / location=Cvel_scaffold558:17820-20400(+) / protein_length=257 / sequence_SO=supercontig / SO=protein_coding / is_pseudo=false
MGKDSEEHIQKVVVIHSAIPRQRLSVSPIAKHQCAQHGLGTAPIFSGYDRSTVTAFLDLHTPVYSTGPKRGWRTDLVRQREQEAGGRNTGSKQRAAEFAPHKAYAACSKSLQHEWKFVVWVIPGVGGQMGQLEGMIRDRLIPALMKGRRNGRPPTQHNMWLRDVAALLVRLLGLGIPKPTEIADRGYKTSAAASEAITEAILCGEEIDADEHVKRGQKARAAYKEAVEKEWERLGSQSGQAASEDQCEEVRQSKKKR